MCMLYIVIHISLSIVYHVHKLLMPELLLFRNFNTFSPWPIYTMLVSMSSQLYVDKINSIRL